jgi:hypothetical protein
MRKNRGLAAVASAFALTVALAFGAAVPAFAADYGQGATTTNTVAATDAKVTKVLHTNAGSTVTAKFSFTATGTTVATDDNGTSSEPTTGLIPTIADVTLTSDGTGADQTGTGAITFPTYTHAGVYAYVITENQPAEITNNDGDEGAMTYSQDKYLMRVYVTNKTDGSGVEIASVTFEKNPTATANGEKVDGNNVKFENTFTEKTNPKPEANNLLTISKKVTGGSGDQSKDWNFTVTFKAPANVPAGWTVQNIKVIDNSGTAQEGKVGADGTVSFTLKHGQSYKFDNVVVGTTYTVTEAESGQDGYTTTGEVKTATVIKDSGTNGTEVVNNKESITPTGLIVNNLPFIMLGCVAVAGVVAYGAAKRKLEK